MPQKPIDVSIVVCTLNEEKRIQDCLEHLRAQRFLGSFEIIVADGTSEDKTVEMAKPLADKIVLEKVRRISVERQAGAKAASGQLLLFTDADTKAPTDWVQKAWNIFEKHPEVVLAYGPTFLHDASESEQRLAKIVMPVFMQGFHWLGLFSPIGSNLAIKKTVFEKIGGFNTRLVTCEDLDLAKRAQKFGKLWFDSQWVMKVSGRRVKKWGYLKFSLFHLWNGIHFHFSGKSNEQYENVR